MIFTVPHYYKRFKCTASDCPDTCCAGWQIMIDAQSLQKYRHTKGALGNRLHNSIDWKETCFKQYEQRCAFLNEDNLCDLYAEGGPSMLCATCRRYPRHVEEFEGCREISLSLSCMEAAKLVLGCEEPVRFLTVEREGEEEYPDFDFFLYTKLADARDLIIQILQNRKLNIRTRMGMVLAFTHDLQRRISGQQLFDVDNLIKRCEKDDAADAFERKAESFRIPETARFHKMKELLGLLDELEVLKKDWPGYAAHLRKNLYGEGPERYEGLRRSFLASWDETDLPWPIWLEQLMVYFVFTYFCGAVYDGRAYGKMKLAAVGTLIIEELSMAVWAEKKGDFCFEDLLETAHRFSREVEHSDLNLNRLEEIFWKNEAGRLKDLLGIIGCREDRES